MKICINYSLCLVLSIYTQAIFAQSNSCVGRCDDPLDTSQPCQCNTACESHNDCCDDYWSQCQGQSQSCAGKCGAGYEPSLPCQCNDKCPQYGNCCPDFNQECGGGGGDGSLSDSELIELSEMLISLDVNNAGSMIEINWGCTTTNGNTQDCSDLPLFANVDPAVQNLPTFAAFSKLFDNYLPSPGQVEDHTEAELQEELDFLQEVMNTEVMKTALQYLQDRGVFSGSETDWVDYLFEIWFKMYDRAKVTLGSSGFEHTFLGECCKNGEVGGFHNWWHYQYLEKLGEINYLGYWEQATFGPDLARGGGISFTFTWNGTSKPYGSMYLGTSPELELALYSICFLTRPDSKCHVSLDGQDVYIQTWTFNQGGVTMVGSAYPDWSL